MYGMISAYRLSVKSILSVSLDVAILLSRSVIYSLLALNLYVGLINLQIRGLYSLLLPSLFFLSGWQSHLGSRFFTLGPCRDHGLADLVAFTSFGPTGCLINLYQLRSLQTLMAGPTVYHPAW